MASKPQDASALDGLGDHLYDRISRMGPPRRALLSSPGRYLQRLIHPTSSQRDFEVSVCPTVVLPPPTPSIKPPLGTPSGDSVESKHYVPNASHPKDHKKPDVDRMRGSGAEEERRLDPEYVSRAQEEGWDAPYSDLFERRMATITESNSVEHSGAGTPLSDQSSVLPPRRTSPAVPPPIAEKTQNRPTNAQLAHIPHITSTTPAPRPRLLAEEALLHCDELNVPPHRPLSRMEKAILRRVEFGQNVDFSRIQLS